MNYKLLFLICLVGLLSNCSKDSTDSVGNFESAIVSSSSTTKFDKLIFLVNIKFSSGKYLVINQIDTIKLKVDTKKWGSFSSEIKDTVGLSDGIYSGFRVSSQKVNYLVYAPYTIDSVGTSTVGDYVKYMQQRLALAVGEHICEFNELKIKNLTPQLITYKPQIFTNFVVETNYTSAYLGEIEIVIK